jgi:GTP-binding protein
MQIRNIAIIAHVDHGKTTLVDGLLKQSGTDLGKSAGQEQIMDSNELERERGITIFSKNASVMYRDAKINIIDTPGHADFGGEVERVLNMADGSLLLVDAQEGPMPQTRFVLKKALAFGHKIIVVVNKIDKTNARIPHTLEKVLELFIELGATNDQIEFPVVYAAGRLGKAGMEPSLEAMADFTPLFEAVMRYIPPPPAAEGPFQAMVVSIAYDNYKGRIAIGRIARGSVAMGMPLAVVAPGGAVVTSVVKKHPVEDRMEAVKDYGPGMARGQGGRIAVFILGGMETTLDEMEYLLLRQKEKTFQPRRTGGEITGMCMELTQRRNDRIKYFQKNPSEKPKLRKKTGTLYLPAGVRWMPTLEPGFKVAARI